MSKNLLGIGTGLRANTARRANGHARRHHALEVFVMSDAFQMACDRLLVQFGAMAGGLPLALWIGPLPSCRVKPRPGYAMVDLGGH